MKWITILTIVEALFQFVQKRVSSFMLGAIVMLANVYFAQRKLML